MSNLNAGFVRRTNGGQWSRKQFYFLRDRCGLTPEQIRNLPYQIGSKMIGDKIKEFKAQSKKPTIVTNYQDIKKQLTSHISKKHPELTRPDYGFINGILYDDDRH